MKAEDKSGLPVSREQELIWWSNYIVFACATVSDAGCSSFSLEFVFCFFFAFVLCSISYRVHAVCEPGNKKIPWMASPADMFQSILSQVKSEVNGDAVVMVNLSSCIFLSFMFDNFLPSYRRLNEQTRKCMILYLSHCETLSKNM